MASLVDDLLLLARLDEGRPLALPTRRSRRARASTPPPTRAAVAPDRDDHRRRRRGRHRRRRRGSAPPGRGATWSATRSLHTPTGTPVSVRVHNGGDRAVVEVHDDGPGMRQTSRSARSSASRAPTRRARATPAGAGLGLAIVRGDRRRARRRRSRSRARPVRARPCAWNCLATAVAVARSTVRVELVKVPVDGQSALG